MREGGRGETDAILEEDEEPEEEEEGNKKEGGRRRVFSVPGSWRFMRPKSRAPAGNETSRGKRVEGR